MLSTAGPYDNGPVVCSKWNKRFADNSADRSSYMNMMNTGTTYFVAANNYSYN